MADSEINLWPYVVAVTHRWRWILAAALIGGGLAALLSLLQPRMYEAEASVIFVGDRTRLSLDERITTRDSAISDPWSRRTGLLDLATSPNIESRLPSGVIQAQTIPDYELGDVTSLISTEQTGDLVWVRAAGRTPEAAQVLATGWAQAYVQFVNTEVFGANSSILAQTNVQLAEAEQSYDVAQQAYADFITTSRTDEVNSQILALEAMLKSNLTLNTDQFMFQVSRLQHLSLLRTDAQRLRDQLATGTSSPGDTLALLLLRIREAGTTGTIPGSMLQLQVDQSPTTPPQQGQLLTELDRFITALDGQLAALQSAIPATRLALTAGTVTSGYTAEEYQADLIRLRDLRGEQASMEARGTMLLQAQDVALEKLQVVQRQLAEQQLSATQVGAEVRLAGEATLPNDPMRRGTVLRAITGSLAGATFGVLLALVAALLPASRRASRAAQRAADSPSYS